MQTEVIKDADKMQLPGQRRAAKLCEASGRRYSAAMMTRRILLSLAAAGLVRPARVEAGIDHLPMSTAFKGTERFTAIVNKAVANNWRALPIGTRMGRIAREFIGVPYVGF